MRKGKQILSVLLVSIIALCALLVPAAAASSTQVATNDWYLIGIGKHLDWAGSSAYSSEFKTAVSTWNGYKSGVIRKSTWYRQTDVTISDYTEESSVAGVTSSSGTIKFNSYRMSGYNTTRKLNVCLHELGHALGLAHNQSGDAMYTYVSNVTSLSANDKASYDSSYARCSIFGRGFKLS